MTGNAWTRSAAWRQRRKPAVFIARPYSESDLEQVIGIYRAVFAEPPWNEIWDEEEVEKDLRFAQAQQDPIILVALAQERIVGFTWGYRLPEEQFPFLGGLISSGANYMDEMAVMKGSRCRGIGKLLGNAYLDAVAAQGIAQSVLRTDERNIASMRLFAKIGYVPVGASTPVYDPEYPDRIYLQRWLR